MQKPFSFQNKWSKILSFADNDILSLNNSTKKELEPKSTWFRCDGFVIDSVDMAIQGWRQHLRPDFYDENFDFQQNFQTL